LALQLGFDYNWLVNAPVRWIDIDTEAHFDLNGSAGSVDDRIAPLVYSIMAGYRF
jgi:outer membrane protein